MDFSALLSDPNFLKFMGNAGAQLGGQGSVGAALNPSGMIEARQNQQAMAPLLEQILSGQVDPTPVGQAGPDSVVTKKTADGQTVTINSPSEKNLNTFGSSVPLEAQPNTPVLSSAEARGGVLAPPSTSQGDNISPFFKALLSR